MLKALSYDEMRGTYSVGKIGSRTQLALTGLFFPNACMIVRSFLFFSTSKGAMLGMALVMFVGHSPELTIHKRSNRTCTAYPGTIDNKFNNERLCNFLLRVKD